MLYAHDTYTHVAAEVALGPVDDVAHHISLATLGHHAQTQRQQIGRDGIVGIAAAAGVEKAGVESIPYPAGIGPQRVGICRLAGDEGKVAHQLHYQIYV